MEKDYGFTGYNRNLLEAARRLRREMTPQERKLWAYLRNYPVRFYRQRIIDRCILDFYCSKAKLGIELDGSQHNTADGKEYDKNRTEVISRYGVYLIRFSNAEIDNHFQEVCKRIDNTVDQRLKILMEKERILYDN